MHRTASSSLLTLGALISLLLPGNLRAATWEGFSGDWNASSNWNPTNIPDTASEDATFIAGTVKSVTLSADTSVRNISFNPGATSSSYTLSTNGRALSVFGNITDGTNSAFTEQNFVAEGNGGAIQFFGNATLGPSILTVRANATLRFSGSTTATNNKIITESASARVFIQRTSGAFDVSTITGPGGILFSTSNAGANTQTLRIGNAFSSDFTFAGTSGSDPVNPAQGALIKMGTGILTLTGANAFSAGINILNGTLRIQDPAGSLSGNITITSPGDLQVNRSDALALAGALQGNGTFSKSGSGTLTLSGGGTFSGTILGTEGRLRVLASLPSASFILSGDSRLEAAGSFAQLTFNSPGSTLAFGQTGSGTTFSSIDMTGGILEVRLGPATLPLVITGDFSALLTSGHKVRFVDAGFIPGNTYELVKFGSTSFQASDFSIENTYGFKGSFVIEDNTLKFVSLPGPAPTPIPVPELAAKSPSKISTTKSTFTLKGTSTGATLVEFKAGKGGFVKAKGSPEKWKAAIRLTSARTVVKVRASGPGGDAKPLKFTITRH